MLTTDQKARKVKTAEGEVATATARLTRAQSRLRKHDEDAAARRAELVAAVTEAQGSKDTADQTLDWYQKAPTAGQPAVSEPEDAPAPV